MICENSTGGGKMININQQIVDLFEKQGVSPEEISAHFEIDVDAVKLILTGKSVLYRKANGITKKEPQLFANSLQLAEATMEGCLYSEHDFVKFRASKFIIDEHKGRNDVNPVKALGNVANTNVLIINQYIKAGRAAVEKARAIKTIDVESSTQQKDSIAA